MATHAEPPHDIMHVQCDNNQLPSLQLATVYMHDCTCLHVFSTFILALTVGPALSLPGH